MTKNEPVGVVYSMQDGYIGQMLVKDIPHKTKLYTHPHQWQGLTDDEIEKIDEIFVDTELLFSNFSGTDYIHGFARAIEQALKEKNTVS
jgi:hypothetical protein